MRTCYLIDLDGVMVEPGTHNLIPGAKERLDSIAADSDVEVWFFSCWAFSPRDLEFLKAQFPYARGYIRKPPAGMYVVVDDRLNRHLCAVDMPRAFEYARLCSACGECPLSLLPGRICPCCGAADIETPPILLQRNSRHAQEKDPPP